MSLYRCKYTWKHFLNITIPSCNNNFSKKFKFQIKKINNQIFSLFYDRCIYESHTLGSMIAVLSISKYT